MSLGLIYHLAVSELSVMIKCTSVDKIRTRGVFVVYGLEGAFRIIASIV